MNIAGGKHNMDARMDCISDTAPRAIDVRAACARHCSDAGRARYQAMLVGALCLTYASCDLLHTGHVPWTGNWKSGFDHIDAQLCKLFRDLQLRVSGE
jgi:hypothetical protein